MDKQINKYCIKLWLTVAVTSFVLFQLPLYYLNMPNIHAAPGGYRTIFAEFIKNWFYIIVLLSVPWFFVFRAVRALYQHYWSLRGFKLATVITAEFLMLFFLVIYFCIFNSNYIIPTSFVIGVFFISTAISVYLHKYAPLQQEFYNEQQLME